MKQATLQIKFDEEKLNAIKQYMGKKDADLQTELDDVMQKLYEKHVPAPVREYIESRDSRVQEKPKDRSGLPLRLLPIMMPTPPCKQHTKSHIFGGCVPLCGLFRGEVASIYLSAVFRPFLRLVENIKKKGSRHGFYYPL
jgi:predicted DNA binding CopG/RHH family protein